MLLFLAIEFLGSGTVAPAFQCTVFYLLLPAMPASLALAMRI